MKKLLPANWSVASEITRSVMISKGVADDLVMRLMASFMTAGLIAWSGLPLTAMIWLSAVLINEGIEPFILKRLQDETQTDQQRLYPYLIHMGIGSCIWGCIGPVLWALGDSATMFLGVAISIGAFVHVVTCYSESRFLSLVVAVPLGLGICAMFLLTFLDPQFSNREKTVIVFGLVTLMVYLVMSTVHGIATNERLHGLVRETERLASEDPLTGLKNRRIFIGDVNALLEDCIRFCVVFIDLDRFKPLNDEYGHATGDYVLREIGRRLKADPDVMCAARFGGDEFAVAMRAEGSKVAIHDRIGQFHKRVTKTIRCDAGDIEVGASFGYALSFLDGADVSDLLHGADRAMMRTKAEQGQLARFDRAIDLGTRITAGAELAFRGALENGRIKAALQPIVQRDDHKIVGYELLARWEKSGFNRDPAPKVFIPIAEKLGLLNDVLWTTLDQACPKLVRGHHRLAINLTPSQLSSSDFLKQLSARLASHQFSPSQVELEVTERIGLRNLEHHAELLGLARDMGFRIVLDGFGSNGGSLSMLKTLPVDKLKLDGQVLRDIQADGQAANVLAATIRFARELGIVSCITHVEDEATANFVLALGCDEIQGFWAGHPALIGGAKTSLSLAS